MQNILRIIIASNTAAEILVAVMSAYVIVSSFFGQNDGMISKLNKSRWIRWIALLIATVVLAGTVIDSLFVRVPDVEGKNYEYAKAILDVIGLQSDEHTEKGLIVSSQSPKAGSIIRKNARVNLDVSAVVPDVVGFLYPTASQALCDAGLKPSIVALPGTYIVNQEPEPGTFMNIGSMVKVSVEGIGRNEEYKNAVNSSFTGDYGSLQITFRETNIQFWDNDGNEECFGSIINNFDIEEVTLTDEKNGSEYYEFSINDDNQLVIDDIPFGKTYKLQISVAGYETVQTTISLSDKYMPNGTMHLTQHLIRNNTSEYGYTGLRIYDKFGKPLSGAVLYVAWCEPEIWSGPYSTDVDGSIDGLILENADQKISVMIVDPYSEGMDYTCELELKRIDVGEPVDASIIFIDGSGEYHIQRESEYHRW